jgi:hypothetical protein
MTSQAVSLTVVAPIPIDCKFWIEDDGWRGVCEMLGIAIHAANFEDAKKQMEATLRERIESVLRAEAAKAGQSVEFRRSA